MLMTLVADNAHADSFTPEPVCLSDTFDRGALGDRWSVASSSGTFGVPRIVGNRMRLTDNAAYNSTGATFLRTTPGKGNKITVTFKYYAYNGNNADGVVLTFSDASVTPQPGGWGGSLGYAPVSNVNDGFAGGWLGVAFDEYGNFSNATEGRAGGIGFTKQAVAIRGSGVGTSGYAYLAGTKTLDPPLDKSGSAAGPGHIYRVTLDTRVDRQALVTVERDIGSGFQTLISSFDALASAGQKPVPERFYMTFTGSTGGQNNVHEIDDFQACANRFDDPSYPIDHFEMIYSDNALTCTPLPVTIRACADAACTVEYDKPVKVSLSPASYWPGGNTVSFTGRETVQYRNPNTHPPARLGVTSLDVPTRPLSMPVCSTKDCDLQSHAAGFIFDVPNVLANRPVEDVVIQAVRADETTQTCAPALANVQRDVRFYGNYVMPNTGTKAISVDGKPIKMVANEATELHEGDQTKLALKFNDEAKAFLKVEYPDAGKMRLNVTYFGNDATQDGYLQVKGNKEFVSKPYGLCLQTVATCSEADVDKCSAFPGVRAGDPFDLTVKAVAWAKDGQPMTAEELCNNPVTPNFASGAIALTPMLAAPADGVVGELGANEYSHAIGNSATVKQSLSEVGIFRITATPGDYFGQTISASQSALIGRITPAYLDVSGAGELGGSCTAEFSYQGQAMAFSGDPTLTVLGKNRAGNKTDNYDRGGFWRMNAPSSPSANGDAIASSGPYVSTVGEEELDQPGRLTLQNPSPWIALSDEEVGDGARSFYRTGETLTYTQAVKPTLSDLPFDAKAKLPLTAAQLTDSDGVCYQSGPDAGSCLAFDLPVNGKQVQLGRLRIGNASGSELQPLDLPWQIESWQASGSGAIFATNIGDTCSAPALGAVVLSNAQGHLTPANTSASVNPVTLQKGVIHLTAPGKGHDGSIQAGFDLASALPWLRFDWNGTGEVQAPNGLATFGIYHGSPPLIFRREVYR
jgi:MSHA biogenesis protein MshQ